MLTTPLLPVNAALPPGVMWRVSDIARRDGVSVPAVSKMVGRLVEQHGLQVERDARGRVIAVNVAHFDELRGQYADPARRQKPDAEDGTSGVTLDAARTRQAYYDGERSRLKLAQEIGELVSRADVEHAMSEAGERIGRLVDQIAGHIDTLAAAYDAGGQQALRVKLRDLVYQAREQIADVLDAFGAEAPAEPPPS